MDARTILTVAGGLVVGFFLIRIVFGLFTGVLKAMVLFVLLLALAYAGQGWRVYRAERERLPESYRMFSEILKNPMAVMVGSFKFKNTNN